MIIYICFRVVGWYQQKLYNGGGDENTCWRAGPVTPVHDLQCFAIKTAVAFFERAAKSTVLAGGGDKFIPGRSH
jgi:hypothetical protein